MAFFSDWGVLLVFHLVGPIMLRRRTNLQRSKLAENPLQPGLLTWLKGDWEWLSTKLGLPSWQERRICHWCTASLDSYADMSKDAPWRANQLSAEDFFAACRANHRQRSPLFSCPGVSTSSVVLDWLHAVDLGCGADLVGAALWEVLQTAYYPGTKRSGKLIGLWADICTYYSLERPSSRIDSLTLGMLKPRGGPPKLSAKGAECKGLYKFGWQLSLKVEGVMKDLQLISCDSGGFKCP